MLKSDGHRKSRLVDFIDQRSEVRGAVLKSFEYISFVLHSRVVENAVDHHKLSQMVSGNCENLLWISDVYRLLGEPHGILDFFRDHVLASTPLQNLPDSKERPHRIDLELYDQAQIGFSKMCQRW